MEKPDFDSNQHYEAIQAAIKKMEDEEHIPFDVDTETVTVTVSKAALDFLRLYEEVPEGTGDLQYRLDLILANGIAALQDDIDGKPDHWIYQIQPHPEDEAAQLEEDAKRARREEGAFPPDSVE